MVSSDEPSSSPSGYSPSTSRKTASRNSYKKLREIQRSDQKLWPFRTVTMVSSDEPSSSPSGDSTSTSRKTASRKSCKKLREIQRSDQKLWPLRTGTMVWNDETSCSPSGDSTSTTRKTASGNYCKSFREINGRIKSYVPFERLQWSGATIPPPHRVAIQHLLQRKQRLETRLKF